VKLAAAEEGDHSPKFSTWYFGLMNELGVGVAGFILPRFSDVVEKSMT
jgi:hypothetical protein